MGEKIVMDKYVELGAVQKKIMEMIGDIRGTYLAQDIGKIPSADVQEVKHGHWIGQPISGYADCKCSVCGAICNVHVSAGIPTQRYCYRCGAKMLEDEKNTDKNE